MGLLALLLALLLARVHAAPAPLDVIELCPAAQLDARQLSAGGAAAGTWRTPVLITNHGPACSLATGSLTVSVGSRSARLDLSDRHDRIDLPTGWSLPLAVTAPAVSSCAIDGDGTRLPASFQSQDGASVPLSGVGLSSAYGCREVSLIAGAPSAAPSR